MHAICNADLRRLLQLPYNWFLNFGVFIAWQGVWRRHGLHLGKVIGSRRAGGKKREAVA